MIAAKLDAAKPLSARAITTYYLSALMVIASLTIASHLILIYILDHNQGDAAIINVSGRQRMLSQRIASLAAQYRLGDPNVRRELLSAIDEFEKSERALHAANLSIKRGDSASVQLEAIYSRGAEPLDVEVRGFVADARRVAALPPGAAAASAPLSELFAQARSSLLNKLDDVVAIHQRETERVLSQLEKLQLAILGIVLLTLAAEALAIFRPMIARIAAYTTELLRLATIDPLTELANRRGFLERSMVEVARARRYDRPLGFLMLDIDHFKQINDTYGHEAGDVVLRLMSDSMRGILRTHDLAGRFGGEEFTILLPETDLAGASAFAERLRETIANLPVHFHQQSVKITVSIGVTSVRKDALGIDDAVRDADALMYRAKQSGRNCVVAG
jgi:diguanylate cyclase (GGDEF)-like protein